MTLSAGNSMPIATTSKSVAESAGCEVTAATAADNVTRIAVGDQMTCSAT